MQPLDPAWLNILPSLGPSKDESWSMLGELRAVLGSDKLTAAAVGVHARAFKGWRVRGLVPKPARRSVWAAWVMFCHPELLATSFDWFTWGRWRTKVQEPGDWPEDYCI